MRAFRSDAGLAVVLLAGYVALMLLPLALAALQDRDPRPFRDDLSSGLALVAFAMLLAEFVLSGRHRGLSARVGMDSIMRFHQFMAHVLVAFILIHPFLYSLPMGVAPYADVDRSTWLALATWPAITGTLAWLGLFMLVFLAAVRDQLPYRYEVWRAGHALGALAVAVLAWHHTVWAGRYSNDPVLAAIWSLALAAAVIALLHVHLVIPVLQSRRPLRVAEVRREAERTWTVELEPDRERGHPGIAFPFRAGQFVWLKLGRPIGRITEHPFSISSAPGSWPRIALTIKEAGDFTDHIGELAPGTPAYLDGPYGNFTLVPGDRRPLVLLAGGVGMAPVMSLLRDLRDRGESRSVQVFQANRHAGQILYREELEAMQEAMDLRVHHVLQEPPPQWQGETGLIAAELLRARLPEDARRDAQWAVCGPPAMIDAVETVLLRDFRVPAGAILSERFYYRFGDAAGTARRFLWAAGTATLGLLAGALWFAMR